MARKREKTPLSPIDNVSLMQPMVVKSTTPLNKDKVAMFLTALGCNGGVVLGVINILRTMVDEERKPYPIKDIVKRAIAKIAPNSMYNYKEVRSITGKIEILMDNFLKTKELLLTDLVQHQNGVYFTSSKVKISRMVLHLTQEEKELMKEMLTDVLDDDIRPFLANKRKRTPNVKTTD